MCDDSESGWFDVYQAGERYGSFRKGHEPEQIRLTVSHLFNCSFWGENSIMNHGLFPTFCEAILEEILDILFVGFFLLFRIRYGQYFRQYIRIIQKIRTQ